MHGHCKRPSAYLARGLARRQAGRDARPPRHRHRAAADLVHQQSPGRYQRLDLHHLLPDQRRRPLVRSAAGRVLLAHQRCGRGVLQCHGPRRDAGRRGKLHRFRAASDARLARLRARRASAAGQGLRLRQHHRPQPALVRRLRRPHPRHQLHRRGRRGTFRGTDRRANCRHQRRPRGGE